MSDEKIKEFVNKQRMKSVETTEEVEATNEIDAPVFSLEKWRIANLPDTPEIRAYVRASREQKTMIVICVLAITVIVNYLKYGVP